MPTAGERRQWMLDQLQRFVDLVYIEVTDDGQEIVSLNADIAEVRQQAYVASNILERLGVDWLRIIPDDDYERWGQLRQGCEDGIGRTSRADELATYLGPQPPTIDPVRFHPIIWSAASKLWHDAHFKQAVAAAAEALVTRVKRRTGRLDISGTKIWQVVYSEMEPKPGEPRLRWPGDPNDEDVKTMNSGLRSFGTGVQGTIRNPSSHGIGELTEQEGLERLAVLSLLARWVEDCELSEAEID